MKEKVNTKFLDLQIDNHIHWKNHIEQTVHELSTACHVVGRRSISVNLLISKIKFTVVRQAKDV